MKKTLVFCTDSLNIGGIEKALLTILEILKDRDEYVLKLCIKNHEKNLLEDNIPKGIEYIFLTRENEKRYFFNILEKMYEKKKFEKFIKGADIIIDYYDGNFYKLFSKVYNIKKVCFFHTILEKLHVYQNGKLSKVLKVYDDYIVLTEGAQKEITNQGVSKDKVHKIYNIVDKEKIISESKLGKVKGNEKDYYLMLGRIVNDSKDYETAIKAFKYKEINEKLLILGDGPYKKNLIEMVRINKLEDKVIFHDGVKNPYGYIKEAKGIILSSRYEGLPNIILEALVFNKRIIASDCPYGPREILGDNEFGELFPIGDEVELVKLLKKSIFAIDKKSIEKKLEEFSPKNICEKLKKIL